MDRSPVSSSVIATVGYDAGSQTLEIEFHSGSVYQYFDVPQTVVDNLLSAASLGNFFHVHIRSVYRYERA